MKKAREKKRQATVTLLVVVCLTVMLSFVAIAVDGGVLLDQRQQVQSAADSAALAAGNQLYLNYKIDGGIDADGSARTAAEAAAKANGFPKVTVNIPPQSGSFKGQKGYVEVIVEHLQKRYFSSLFGSSNLPVRARAVAQGRWTAAKVGVLVLHPTRPGSLTTTGGGKMTVVGVPMIVNSNAPDAITVTGNGTASAPEFDITGTPGISGSGHFIGTIYNGQDPIPDPLAYLPEPDRQTMTVQDRNGLHLAGTQTRTIYPGVYKNGITVSGQATLSMAPGIYYMDGGGFSFTGQGSLNAPGVMIVNAPQQNSDTISINGTGVINITPQTNGIYKGISLWQERSSSNTVTVSGNGGSTMKGTFYAAGGKLNVTGNGTNDVIGSQYISSDLVVNGNGSFQVDWDAEMTGQTRILGLVE